MWVNKMRGAMISHEGRGCRHQYRNLDCGGLTCLSLFSTLSYTLSNYWEKLETQLPLLIGLILLLLSQLHPVVVLSLFVYVFFALSQTLLLISGASFSLWHLNHWGWTAVSFSSIIILLVSFYLCTTVSGLFPVLISYS